MHFALELLKASGRRFPPHWRGKLLDTKPLEALLRSRPSTTSSVVDVGAPFFEELRQQMQRVSK